MPATRPAIPTDAPHIATIKIESWREAYAHIINPQTLAKLHHPTETQKFLDRITQNEHLLVRTNQNNIPIAYAYWIELVKPQSPLSAQSETGQQSLIQTDWPYPNMLASLYVHPNHYHQGHGTALIAATAELALHHGHHGMMIGVFTQNHRALSLYTKLGAVLHKETTFKVDGIDYPDLILAFHNLQILVNP